MHLLVFFIKIALMHGLEHTKLAQDNPDVGFVSKVTEFQELQNCVFTI
jgi:hypothetical protein